MIENTQVIFHSNQMIKTLNKIIILLITQSVSEQDKDLLVQLGQRHYHYGLKKEYFDVFESCFILSLKEILNITNKLFYDKFENPWKKLIKFTFKQYIDEMITEKWLKREPLDSVIDYFF